MLAAFLALAASLLWGSSDFLADRESRRTAVWALALVSQITALVAALAVLAVVAPAAPNGPEPEPRRPVTMGVRAAHPFSSRRKDRRMSEPTPLRRGDKAITEVAELYRIIDEAPVLRLAMVDEGRPYVVPLNFAREGDTLWLHCASAGRKLECLRRDPAVCVEVDHFLGIAEGSDSDPCSGWTARYESVIGFGVAEIAGDEQDKVHGLLAIMRKFSGRGAWTFSQDMLGKIAVVRVRLGSLTGKRSPL